MNRSAQIVFDTFIEPTKKQNYKYIGTEFEYPIFCKDKNTNLREIGGKFLEMLIADEGYIEAIRGSDGVLVRIDKDGDSVSFDYHYAMLELSISPQESLLEIKRRHDVVVEMAINYYKNFDCQIIGVGNYYYGKPQQEYTNDPFYTMIRAYLSEYLHKENVGEQLCNMCSVQTHLDVPYSALLKTYNLFNEISFVRGLLMSNSPLRTKDGDFYCTRDDGWVNSGIPNAGLYDTHFKSLEDLAVAISNEKIFVKNENGNLTYMPPVPLTEYFDEKNEDADKIAFFRSFKHVVINKYNCLEVREDCIQPLGEDLVTVAFNLGMALGVDEATSILKQFKTDANLTEKTNNELRNAATHNQFNVDEKLLKSFLKKLYEVAKNKLVERSLGEEKFLEPLYERIEKLECPAKKILKG